MTNPPQPGQQPYGQPPRGPYSQQGPPQQGFPGSSHYGLPGYPFPGGFSGPPPRKNKRALWISLVVALAVIVALVITGFVAPGFFLSKDSQPSDGDGAGPSASAPVLASETTAPDLNTDSAQAVATQYVDAFNNGANPDGSYNPEKNKASLDLIGKLSCPDEIPDRDGYVGAKSEVGDGAKLQITNNKPDSNDPQNMVFTVTSSIRKSSYNLVVANRAAKFCVFHFAKEKGQSQGSPDRETAVAKMFDAIKAKDAAAANAFSCAGSGSENVDGITKAINAASSWQPGPDQKPSSPTPSLYTSYFSGKIDGKSRSLSITAAMMIGEGWCILKVSV